MRKLTLTIAATAALAAVASTANADTFVRMVSGPAGGSWYPFGAKIMEVLQRDVAGIRTSNGPGGGTGNVRTIGKGNAEFGWTFGFTAYNGYEGKGKFKKAYKDVRFFATLYPGVMQTAVPMKSNIRTYADLKDKNISPGKIVFSGNTTMEKLLALYGVSYGQIKKNGGAIHRVGYKDSVALMKDGHIDAFVGLTTAPNSSFIALDFSPGIRFLPVSSAIADKFVAQNPGFFKASIKAGTYKGVKADVPTISTATVMITHKNVSDELVYKITKAFWNARDEIGKVHGNWRKVHLKSALQAAAVPTHPGALKYYSEMGIKK
jgi:hypothetical protein